MEASLTTGIESLKLAKELTEKLFQWFQWDKNDSTRAEVLQLINDRNIPELERRFLGRIEFGTAGLRSRMAAGFTMMNDLIVIQTAQGLAKYLLSVFPHVKDSGVVIGFDGRHNSKKWAYLSAAIMMNHGIRVHLFSVVVPTPYVPFAVRHLKSVCGVMVTASHNPKDDNGYKVYWDNGAQIVSPHDKEISRSITENLIPAEPSWDISQVLTHALHSDPVNEIDRQYFSGLARYVHYRDMNSSETPVPMVYTAMHGVGRRYAAMCFKTFGFSVYKEQPLQIDPDPDFPTVVFPNPEEGKSALNLSIQTAEEYGASLILANDPDADRLAVAEKNRQTDVWKVFSGNEIGALLGWWCWEQYKREHTNSSADSVYMLASAVSSKILSTMAEVSGFHFEETLVGFKWMGNRAVQLQADGKLVLLAFEEAIGFMVGTHVFDKDGISAMGVMYEMANFLNRLEEPKQLQDQLDEIYLVYGQHVSLISYYICHEPVVIKTIFEHIRNFLGRPNTYPTSVCGVGVVHVRDLTTGYDTQQPGNVAVLPVSKSSQMITFIFTNNVTLTLRTSGTEPKIKYYSEIIDPATRGLPLNESKLKRHELETSLTVFVENAAKELLQPEKHGLITRSS